MPVEGPKPGVQLKKFLGKSNSGPDLFGMSHGYSFPPRRHRFGLTKGSAPLLTANYAIFPSETRPINTQVTRMHSGVRLVLVLKAQTFHLKC